MSVPDSETVVRLKELLGVHGASEERLAEAALLVARARNPQLDIAAYLRQIDDWASYLRTNLISEDADAAERIESLNRFLFDELGFTGNSGDPLDPGNSLLDAVIDRRLGIPITLSVLYIELGRRIGLPLQGVSFPGHFLVILPVSHGVVVLDPYSEGASLEFSDLERLLHQVQPDGNWDRDQVHRLLAPAELREILVRMLRNLKANYWSAKDLVNAIWVQDMLLAVDDGLAEERRDRGILNEQAGRYQAASEDLKEYLRRTPEAVDAELVRTRIVELSRRRRHLH
jgi:regulator of sirC expression with transglutaminase-like and TPR domain